MRKLNLTFLNSEGKKHTFSPALAAQDLTAETVQTQMAAMTDLAIFQKDDVRLFEQVSGAKYVETIETELF